MKLDLHPEIRSRQQYTCKQCARACRTFLVPLRMGEAQAIGKLRDWRGELGVSELFVKNKQVRPAGQVLAKQANGRCVFLGDDNLCEIHRHHGYQAKPLACRLYPFVLSPVAGRLRVGLRFDCPAVCENAGRKLADHYKGIDDIATELVPKNATVERAVAPELASGRRLSDDQFERINETFLRMASSNALTIYQRLIWINEFVNHLVRIKKTDIPIADFVDLLKLFEGGLLAELHQCRGNRESPPIKVRKMLGQIFFLLCQTTIQGTPKTGLLEILRHRVEVLRFMRQLSDLNGVLPRLHTDWPDCSLTDLEGSFGDWPAEVQEMIERFLVCRIGGALYCGPNFYNYNMVDGMRTLLLGVIAIGWTMRIHALKNGRECLELPDAHAAVMTVDGNLGYAPALGQGPARLRMSYLAPHLSHLIDWYCT